LHYSKLMEATLAAENARKNIFTSSTPKHTPITDLTDRPRRGRDGKDAEQSEAPASSTNARSVLQGLQREKVCQGVVEYVFSGSRLKVMVPRENSIISLALVGIRCPRYAEPFGPEATEHVRSLCLQRDVRIEIETMDKGENFLGTCWCGPVGNPVNVGKSLLEKGFASIVGFSAEKSPYGAELIKAEEVAKEAKIGMWENYVEPAAVAEDGDESAVGTKDVMDVIVTEIADAVTFYVQIKDDPNAAIVKEAMAEFNENVPEAKPEMIEKNQILAGLYTDDQWYRVKTEGMERGQTGMMRVYFIDFGNHELLEEDKLRALPQTASSLPGLARPALLAGLRAPTKLNAHFESAAITFNDYVYGEDRVLSAKRETIDKTGKMHLTLTDPEHPDLSINAVLLRDGWCRVVDRPERKLRGIMDELQKCEDMAKQNRLNVWEYGDVSDEEEDDKPSSRFDGRTGKPITR